MKTTRKGAASATRTKKAASPAAVNDAPTKSASRRTRVNAATEGAADDSLESRVTSFAEQVGRLAGTVAGKADGWMDGSAIQQQLAAVRDSAAGLLRQIAGREAEAGSTVAKVARAVMPTAQPAMAKDAGVRRSSRSGGKVDAPGKKHRGPQPADPDDTAVTTQSAKMRSARPMAKTSRLRGRG